MSIFFGPDIAIECKRGIGGVAVRFSKVRAPLDSQDGLETEDPHRSRVGGVRRICGSHRAFAANGVHGGSGGHDRFAKNPGEVRFRDRRHRPRRPHHFYPATASKRRGTEEDH